MSAQSVKLVPPVKAQLAQPRAGEDDIERCANDWDKCERKVDDHLEDLDEAPRSVFSVRGGFS